MPELVQIYTSPQSQARCLAAYEAALAHWPVPYQQLDLPTRFGDTHIIACGDRANPPLVLLHGQWASAVMWSNVAGQLSRSFRLIAPDQIDDAGKSCPTRRLAGRPDYAQWLSDVFDGLELVQADLAGLSYGGFLALNFALAAPRRVRRLALLCPGVPAFGPPAPKWALHGLPLMLAPSRLAARWLVQGLSLRGYRADDLEIEQLVVSALSLRNRIPFHPAIAESEFSQLELPVLFLVGEGEIMYDAEVAVSRARQLIPHVQAELVRSAGHMLTSDQPQAVAGRLLQFLRS
jgi:pimeloyl-ACP methyl ester carboxylesterase